MKYFFFFFFLIKVLFPFSFPVSVANVHVKQEFSVSAATGNYEIFFLFIDLCDVTERSSTHLLFKSSACEIQPIRIKHV